MKQKYGFADSKQLTEKQRDMLFAKMNEMEFSELGYFVESHSPQDLSAKM